MMKKIHLILTIFCLNFFFSCSDEKAKETTETDSVVRSDNFINKEVSFSEVFQNISEPIQQEFPLIINDSTFGEIQQKEIFNNKDTLEDNYLANSYPFLSFLRNKNTTESFNDMLVYHQYKRFKISNDLAGVIFYTYPYMQGTAKQYSFELFIFKMDGTVIDHRVIGEKIEDSYDGKYSINVTACVMNKIEAGFELKLSRNIITGKIGEDKVSQKTENLPIVRIGTDGKIK